MAEQIKMQFGVNTHGGPWNIVLNVGLDPPRKEKKAHFSILGTPSYLQNG